MQVLEQDYSFFLKTGSYTAGLCSTKEWSDLEDMQVHHKDCKRSQ